MLTTNHLLSLPMLVMLASCGFAPIHGNISRSDNNSIERQLSQIIISTIPNREGQYLRNQLLDRLANNTYGQNPTYILNVATVNETISDLDITKSSDATRAQLRISTTMVLQSIDTEEVLISRTIRSIASYNILSSQFTTRVSEQDARESALNDLAQRIETHITLYLNRN